MRTRKTWREKMENPNLPKLVDMPPRMQKRLGAGTLLIPSPRDVEAVIRGIPQGEVMTVGRIRERLAAQYANTSACPLVTGIFVRISAEAAEEDANRGKTAITPYWRVVKNDGSLNPKFPGGEAQQARHLRDEGIQTLRRGKKILVKGFEKTSRIGSE